MKQRYRVDIWIDNFEAEIILEDMTTNEVVRGRTESFFGASHETIREDIAAKIVELFEDMEGYVNE